MKPESVERRAEKLGKRMDEFLGLLLLTYAQALFLRPMRVNVELIARYGVSGGRAGFEGLRMRLYWAFILDLMKLSADEDRRYSRTASIPVIMRELRQDPELRDYLFKRHSRPGIPRMAKEAYAQWRSFSKEERARLRKLFRERYARVRKNFSALKRSREYKGFQKIRHTTLAHFQVKNPRGTIGLFDPSRLGLKIGDEAKVLESAKAIATDLNSIIRGASFSWDSYLAMEERDICAFWQIENLEGPVPPKSDR